QAWKGFSFQSFGSNRSGTPASRAIRLYAASDGQRVWLSAARLLKSPEPERRPRASLLGDDAGGGERSGNHERVRSSPTDLLRSPRARQPAAIRAGQDVSEVRFVRTPITWLGDCGHGAADNAVGARGSPAAGTGASTARRCTPNRVVEADIRCSGPVSATCGSFLRHRA